VTIDVNPREKSEAKVFDGDFAAPRAVKEERCGYFVTKRLPHGKVVALTVHWAASLGLAPLEIRHKIGRTGVGRFERRVVVQLPEAMPVLPNGGAHATPVVYAERRDKELSGWVAYQSAEQIKAGASAARVSMGSLQPAASGKGGGGSGGGGGGGSGGGGSAVTAATAVATRKQVDGVLRRCSATSARRSCRSRSPPRRA
jgi:uncharacterized membrane protein YgcG